MGKLGGFGFGVNSIDATLFGRLIWNTCGQGGQPEFVALTTEQTPAATSDVKLIAYYLPQFHPIPENDRWWGAGFTEWRNVTRAFPVFPDHYQPRVPGELGYYDLRVPDTMRRQVELAKQHGISGFCFHFYWFNGKRLLELPILSFLQQPEFDLQFSLCWANENWSRRWDGGNNELLIAHHHSREDDIAFIRYLDRYFQDSRYIKVDGKPVLTVYRPAIVEHMKETIATWREQAIELGYPGLYVIATNSFNFQEFEQYGFDALTEFPPHSVRAARIEDQLTVSPFRSGGNVFSYDSLVEFSIHQPPVATGTIHPGAAPGWDNSARRPFDGAIYHGATPEIFSRWLQSGVDRARANRVGERFVFINAWNEWAEGAYLEPDQRFGYAYLAACAETVRRNPRVKATVSAIVPNYNHAPFLAERLNSILRQTLPVSEIIVLDDASTDNSHEIIEAISAASPVPIHFVPNERNSGSVFSQWSKGISLAKGDFVWMCESDDSCDPGFLQALAPHLDDPSVMIAFGKIDYVDRDGKLSPELDNYREAIWPGYWQEPHIESAQSWFDGPFGVGNVIPNAGGCVIRRQRIEGRDLEDLLTYKVCGDWHLYSQLSRGGRIAYEPSAKAYFRQHGGNTSVLSSQKQSFFEEHLRLARVLRRHHDVSAGTTRKMIGRVLDHYRSVFGDEAEIQFSRRSRVDEIVSEPRTTRHILIALYGFQTGGGELFPIHLANELARRGHSVSVLVATTENENERVRRLLAPSIPVFSRDFVDSIGVNAFFQEYGVDLIHTHNVGLDMWLHAKADKLKARYIVTHHGSYEAVPPSREMTQWLLKNVDHTIYIAKKNLFFLDPLQVDESSFTQLPNAMPSNTAPFALTRHDLGIPADAFVFGLASRALHAKGWDVAVRALGQLRERTHASVYLLLCGDGVDFHTLFEAHGSAAGVHFLGYQENIPSFYGLCDACVLPTRFIGESYPLTLIEAIQAGIPVIATDIGEITNIVRGHGLVGIVVPYEVDDGLFEASVTEAMHSMMDQAVLERFRQNLGLAAERHSMPRLVDRHEEIYWDNLEVADPVSASLVSASPVPLAGTG